MARALIRQWLVLTMLPKPPRKIDAATIEARLRERGIEVHRRTVQRDLLELATVFPIVADERAKPFGWRWADSEPTLTIREPKVMLETVSLRVRKVLLKTLRALHDAHVVSEDGVHALITASFEDAERLLAFVSKHAGDVEVREPRKLRSAIARRAHMVFELHAE